MNKKLFPTAAFILALSISDGMENAFWVCVVDVLGGLGRRALGPLRPYRSIPPVSHL